MSIISKLKKLAAAQTILPSKLIQFYFQLKLVRRDITNEVLKLKKNIKYLCVLGISWPEGSGPWLDSRVYSPEWEGGTATFLTLEQ